MGRTDEKMSYNNDLPLNKEQDVNYDVIQENAKERG